MPNKLNKLVSSICWTPDLCDRSFSLFPIDPIIVYDLKLPGRQWGSSLPCLQTRKTTLSKNNLNSLWILKGGTAKTSLAYFLFFTISQLIQHQNLNICVPTPHNTLVIMWGRDKNFKVLMLYELRNRERKKYVSDILLFHPLFSNIEN